MDVAEPIKTSIFLDFYVGYFLLPQDALDASQVETCFSCLVEVVQVSLLYASKLAGPEALCAVC